MSTPAPGTPEVAPAQRRDRTHYLYVAVVVAVVLGVAVGLLFPDFASGLAWIGDAFVALIKMMIQPVIFCTIVLGVGSVRSAASVGKVGGLALGYFLAEYGLRFVETIDPVTNDDRGTGQAGNRKLLGP